MGHLDLPRAAHGALLTKRDRDLADLRRSTIIWIFVVAWIALGYAVQDPAPDPYSAAARTTFTYAMLVIVPLVSAVLTLAWVLALRRPGR